MAEQVGPFPREDGHGVLISFHIPKTAGTAWRLFIEANAGSHTLFDYGDGSDESGVLGDARRLIGAGGRAEARAVIDQSGAKMIHGHRALEFAPLYSEPAILAFLRDPRERMAAEYLHLRTYLRPESDVFRGVHEGRVGFGEFAAHRGNLYVKLLTERTPDDARLLAVPSAYAGEAAAACRRVLSWRGSPPRRNVAPRRQKEEAAALLAEHASELETVLAPDIAFYRDWVERWRNGSGRTLAEDILRSGPRRISGSPFSALRRRLGVIKEQTGRLIGADWR